MDIERLNRRIMDSNKFILQPRTIRLKFKDQTLPKYISIYRVKHDVSPHVTKTRICYSCFRIGHVSNFCKSKPRSIHYGMNRHPEGVKCPSKSLTDNCLNCSGNHLPTSVECPAVVFYQKIRALAASDNLFFAEAKNKLISSLPSSREEGRNTHLDFRNFLLLPHVREDSLSSRPSSLSSPRLFSSPQGSVSP